MHNNQLEEEYNSAGDDDCDEVDGIVVIRSNPIKDLQARAKKTEIKARRKWRLSHRRPLD